MVFGKLPYFHIIDRSVVWDEVGQLSSNYFLLLDRLGRQRNDLHSRVLFCWCGSVSVFWRMWKGLVPIKLDVVIGLRLFFIFLWFSSRNLFLKSISLPLPMLRSFYFLQFMCSFYFVLCIHIGFFIYLPDIFYLYPVIHWFGNHIAYCL